MAESGVDARQKLLAEFEKAVEVRKPDYDKILTTPVAELEAGRLQARTLADGLVRPNPEGVDTQAIGGQRFPEMQGTAALFAEGLAKNQDIVDEIFAAPEVLIGAAALDQAIGRLIFAGELLSRGGDTGEVLAGASAQKLCMDAVTEAEARIKDEAVPAVTRSDINVAFAEPFRLEADYKQRQQQAQAASQKSAQPYLGTISQAREDTGLTDAVSAYLSSLKLQGAQ